MATYSETTFSWLRRGRLINAGFTVPGKNDTMATAAGAVTILSMAVLLNMASSPPPPQIVIDETQATHLELVTVL